MAKLPLSPVLAGIVLFAGGLYLGGLISQGQRPTVPPPTIRPETGAPPSQSNGESVIVPVWSQGRVAAFVAVEMTVDFTPGTSVNASLPLVHDRLLRFLYARGAEGDLQPDRVDPARLKTEMVRIANEAVDGHVQDITLNKMIHQINQRS